MTSSPRRFRAGLLACALAFGTVAAVTPLAPAHAQAVSFDAFHDELARSGDWVYSDRWGEVWIPGDVDADFHPYDTNGRWVDTDEYGYVWDSDYDWGEIAFHYGRWVNDPDDGWLWIPGTLWSPGWVVWRSNDRYMGWMPLPPDDDFLGGNENVSFRFSFGGVTANFDNTSGYYGYARWYGGGYDDARFAQNWVFVSSDRIRERNYRPYVVKQPVQIIRETRNVTNYTVVNNYIVNRSIDARAGGRGPGGGGNRPTGGPNGRPQPARAADVLKHKNFITTVDSGRQVQARMVQEAPHGRGTVDSAPKAPPAVAARLSSRIPPRAGRTPSHLFTKQTVNAAPAPAQPAAQPSVSAGAPAAAPARAAEDTRGRDPRQPEGRQPDGRPSNGRLPDARQPDRRQPAAQPAPPAAAAPAPAPTPAPAPAVDPRNAVNAEPNRAAEQNRRRGPETAPEVRPEARPAARAPEQPRPAAQPPTSQPEPQRREAEAPRQPNRRPEPERANAPPAAAPAAPERREARPEPRPENRPEARPAEAAPRPNPNEGRGRERVPPGKNEPAKNEKDKDKDDPKP